MKADWSEASVVGSICDLVQQNCRKVVRCMVSIQCEQRVIFKQKLITVQILAVRKTGLQMVRVVFNNIREVADTHASLDVCTEEAPSCCSTLG